MSANPQPQSPNLIADPHALADWLKAAPAGSPWRHDNGDTSLDDWLALGDDCTEAQFRQAKALGVPLVRLADLTPDGPAIALVRPEVARRLRVVPLLVSGGSVAVASRWRWRTPATTTS